MGRLLADAETREDPTEQAVGIEAAGDFVDRGLARAKFFGRQFTRSVAQALCRGGQVRTRRHQRIQVPLPGTEAARVATGVPAEQSLCNDVELPTTHPDDVDNQREMMEQLNSGAIDSFTLEKRYQHPDGHTVWAMLSLRRFRDALGTRVAAHGGALGLPLYKALMSAIGERDETAVLACESQPTSGARVSTANAVTAAKS